MPLGDALRDVGLGAGIGPKPADGDDVQRAVGCSITASVEAMAGRPAARGRHRRLIHAHARRWLLDDDPRRIRATLALSRRRLAGLSRLRGRELSSEMPDRLEVLTQRGQGLLGELPQLRIITALRIPVEDLHGLFVAVQLQLDIPAGLVGLAPRQESAGMLLRPE